MLNIISQPSSGLPKLLIVHGLYGSARNWGVISKRLSDIRDVSAVDMRNHGASPWYDSHTYPDMARDLALVIEHLGGPVDVIGHSMGGKAAMTLALTHPELIHKLIVADIAPVAYTHNPSNNIHAMRQVDLSRVERRADALEQLQDLEPGLADFFLQSLDMKEKRWRLNLNVLEKCMPEIVGWPSPPGKFEGDALFLSGAKSDYVRTDHKETIREKFPNAKFAKLKDAGHWLHAEKPREFEAAVRSFLLM